MSHILYDVLAKKTWARSTTFLAEIKKNLAENKKKATKSPISGPSLQRVIYNEQIEIMELVVMINKYFDDKNQRFFMKFHLMKRFGRRWPVLGVGITASH